MDFEKFLNTTRFNLVFAGLSACGLGATMALIFAKAVTELLVIFFTLSLVVFGFSILVVLINTHGAKKYNGVVCWLAETKGETLGALYALDANGSPVLEVLKKTGRLDVLAAYKAYLKAEYEKARARAHLDEPNSKGAGYFFSNLGKELLNIEALPTWKEMETEEEFRSRASTSFKDVSNDLEGEDLEDVKAVNTLRK